MVIVMTPLIAHREPVTYIAVLDRLGIGRAMLVPQRAGECGLYSAEVRRVVGEAKRLGLLGAAKDEMHICRRKPLHPLEQLTIQAELDEGVRLRRASELRVD